MFQTLFRSTKGKCPQSTIPGSPPGHSPHLKPGYCPLLKLRILPIGGFLEWSPGMLIMTRLSCRVLNGRCSVLVPCNQKKKEVRTQYAIWIYKRIRKQGLTTFDLGVVQSHDSPCQKCNPKEGIHMVYDEINLVHQSENHPISPARSEVNELSDDRINSKGISITISSNDYILNIHKRDTMLEDEP